MQAEANLQEQVALHFFSLDQFLSSFPLRKSSHSGAIRNIINSQIMDQPMSSVEYIFELSHDEIRLSDIETYVEKLCDFGESFCANFAGHSFDALDQITAATGE